MRKTWGLLLFVFAIAGMAYGDDWNRGYKVQGRPTLVVDADDGNVIVSGESGNGVHIGVHTEGWRIAPDEIEVNAQQDGNRILVTLRKHKNGIHIHFHTSLEIRVTLPTDSDLDVHTRDGNLEVQRVNGTQKLRTGDGNAFIRDVNGSVDVDTGDGNLNVDGRFEALSLRTGDGNIDAKVRSDSSVKTGWSIRTGDGNINLYLPSNFAADLDAHTGDGHVRSELPVTTTTSSGQQNDLRGKLNGGGLPISIRTGDGNIEIWR